jgi:alpha-tubulin suppressor-like RCC1 family protein
MVDIYSVERIPLPVKFSEKFVDFAVGTSHVVALTESNEVYIWGARTWLDPRKIVPSFEERAGTEDGIPKIAKVEQNFTRKKIKIDPKNIIFLQKTF